MGEFIHTQALPRRAALAGLILGAGLVQLGRPSAANAQTAIAEAGTAAGGAARASGPIVQHGLGPRLTIHALDIYHRAPATGMKIDFSVFRFHVGAYFKAADGLADEVPVRFSVFDAAQHYHVPMLCSPWFFSTYRGS